MGPESIKISGINDTAICRRVRRDRFTLAGLLALSIFLLNAPSCFAQSGSTLGSLEQKLFFKSYGDETDDARLARLEKHLFGQQMEGAFQERLNRVMGAASPQTNPDGSVSGMSSQQSSSTTNSVKPPTEAELKERAEDDRQAAMERAKIAVAAARDEQTNKLIESGVSLWRAKRGTEALQYFEQALKADPHNANALYYAGIVYESKKSYIEALSSYRKASNEDPGNQEYNEAVVAVQKLMNSRPAIDPKQAEISKLATEAGEAYKHGEYLSALDLYKQLDQKAPNQALVKYNLGTLYLHAGQYQTALEFFEIAVKLRPTDQKFVQAYRQLKASVDRSQAAEQVADMNYNGRSGAGGNGQSGGQGQQKPYGHEAMNMGAHASAGQNNALSGNGGASTNGVYQGGNQPGSGYSQQSGANNNQSNANAPNFSQSNNQQQFAPNNVATPPGTGHEPGYTAKANNAPLQNSAATQNKGRKPGSPTIASTQSQPGSNSGFGSNQSQFSPDQSQQNQSQQNQGQTQMSSAPQQQQYANQAQFGQTQSGQAQSGQNQNSFNQSQSGQNQNSFNQSQSGQPQQQQGQSQYPAGQHPLVRHPLKGSKPAPQNGSSNQGTFQPEPDTNFARLQQPAGNPLTELGIMASNGKNGVTIAHVGIASRASKAGLLQGDIIRAVDNKVVSSMAQVSAMVSKKPSGAPIELHIQRKDQMGVVHL